jgi:hypothetical protein
MKKPIHYDHPIEFSINQFFNSTDFPGVKRMQDAHYLFSNNEYQLVCTCNGYEQIGKNKVENTWDKLMVYVSIYEEYYPTIFQWGYCPILNF